VRDVLDVHWGNDRVGKLSLDEKREFIFQYVASWLGNPSALPLSIRLPLREEKYSDDACRAFFVNLLPEGGVRASIARKLGVSESNDFMLIRLLGGECAGAVSLRPEGAAGPGEGGYTPLRPAELDKRIDHMGQTSLLVSQEDQRLSLAGAQEKLPVFIRDGKMFSPRGSAPSSHILKPAVPGYADIVENEVFCMRLAPKAGLPAPVVGFWKGRHLVYRVERYDRERDAAGDLTRIHQEDFCQALGFGPSEKYEAEGGPDLARCFGLLTEHGAQPLIDKRRLLQWVVFNFLIGNADAHGKNISMLITRDGYRLAPFYDVLSTRLYPRLAKKMAMKIGGENRPDWVFKRHWDALAVSAGVKGKAVADIAGEMGETLPGLSRQVAEELAGEIGPRDVWATLPRNIATSAQRLLSSLAAR
jgi:serine/threonine-protein kinase HipA